MKCQIELAPELQRVLWACLQCVRQSPNPELDQSLCFSWVAPIFRKAFGCDFHQSRLQLLVASGLLRQSDSTRAGNRRYYTIANLPDAERIVESLGVKMVGV